MMSHLAKFVFVLYAIAFGFSTLAGLVILILLLLWGEF